MCGVTDANPTAKKVRLRSVWIVVVRDAAIIFAACAVVSILINAIRSDGIAFVQKDDYQILVPCPETTGDVDPIPPDSPLLSAPHVLVIDARSSQEFAQWHAKGAINIPFDYLEPTSIDNVQRTISSGAQKVVVYGDGSDPDTGEQLGRELSGKGVRNVHFVRAGAPAIIAATKQGATP